MPVSRPSLLARVQDCAHAAGADLMGLVLAADFDSCQPACGRASARLPRCGSILVLASGGRGFWDRAALTRGSAPLRQWNAALASSIAEALRAEGVAGRVLLPEHGVSLNFASLGEMAGLGTVSPVLGCLLHPDYGPWLAMRAAVLVEGEPFGHAMPRPVSAGFQPCLVCEAPCVSSCSGGAFPSSAFDGRSCAQHRHAGGCADRCEARGACPLGEEHRLTPAQEVAAQRWRLSASRRRYGFGWWSLVPRRYRVR
ncbi:MAG: hypothetical protein AAF628_30280 [Planctomycetota bacterium]